MENISEDIKKRLLYLMLKIRRFEEKIVELYPAQEIKTPVHLYIGQEAIAAGVCVNLKADDYIFSNHRNHGHYIAKGADINLLMAELYGKVTGCSKGKGGSMHPVAVEWGILGTSAIVGAGIGLAAGAALASVIRKDNKVSVAFFGDGAVDEGIFHEGLNFAALKKLPVLFVCENNFYATNSPSQARQSTDNIYKKAQGYGINSIRIDGNDVLAVYSAVREAVKGIRAGLGPIFIECRTYRYKGHVGTDCDYEKGCRPKEELEEWMAKCPVDAYKNLLLSSRMISDYEYKSIIGGIDSEIAQAVSFAQDSLFPDKSDLYNDVFAQADKF